MPDHDASNDPAGPDPATCPLCQRPNGCVMARGGECADCWCVARPFAPEILARVPPAAKGRACICERCATASQDD